MLWPLEREVSEAPGGAGETPISSIHGGGAGGRSESLTFPNVKAGDQFPYTLGFSLKNVSERTTTFTPLGCRERDRWRDVEASDPSRRDQRYNSKHQFPGVGGRVAMDSQAPFLQDLFLRLWRKWWGRRRSRKRYRSPIFRK